MSEPEFSPSTETEYNRLPQVYRDADEEQVYPRKVIGVEERHNYIRFPSFELSAPGRIGAMNEIANPSFEGVTTGSMEVYKNVVTNPRGITKDAETVVVRKNLVNRSLIAGLNNTLIQPKADTSRQWDIATPGNSNGGGVRIPVPTNQLANGDTYTFSVEVRNPNNVPMNVSIAWGTNSGEHELSLAPGATSRVFSSGLEGIYLTSNSSAFIRFGGGVLPLQYRNPLIERAGATLPYFDGSSGNVDPDLVPAWTGAPEESMSVLEGVSIKGWDAINGVVYWAPSIGKAKLFVPFSGSAGARAEIGSTLDNDPVTAMARPHTNDGTKWLAKYDGAYPIPEFKDPAGGTITELQYPVVGGTEPPQDSYVGQYWINDQNTPYRRIR